MLEMGTQCSLLTYTCTGILVHEHTCTVHTHTHTRAHAYIHIHTHRKRKEEEDSHDDEGFRIQQAWV